jgi:hypothetical protein
VGSNDAPYAASETPRETAPQPEDPQRRHKDGTILALAIAKANLAMDDTERALRLVNEQLASRTPHPASMPSSVGIIMGLNGANGYGGREPTAAVRRVGIRTSTSGARELIAAVRIWHGVFQIRRNAVRVR